MLTFLENSLWDVDRCILRVYTIAPIHSSIYNTVQIVDSCQSRARCEFVSGYMSDSEEGFNIFQYGHLEVLMATGSVSLGDVWMLCSEKLRWTLGAWLSFLNASSSTYTMAAPCGDRKQFGNRCGLTIRRSKIQFLVWDSELRLAIMCFIYIYIYMCFLVMSFAQFLICCGCFLLKASLLMSSWLVILLLSFLAATCFCRTFTPPASPRTRGPRTRCKFTRRCFFFRCHKKGRHGAGMWRGWRSDAPGEQRHQQGELPEEV